MPATAGEGGSKVERLGLRKKLESEDAPRGEAGRKDASDASDRRRVRVSATPPRSVLGVTDIANIEEKSGRAVTPRFGSPGWSGGFHGIIH